MPIVRLLNSLSDGIRTAEAKATGSYACCTQRECCLCVVAHHALNSFPKAYDVRRSPSPALAEDAQITVRRQQNARQSGVRFGCPVLPC